MAENKRCGFVALLGAPNAGKSTLLNTLTGSRLSIVSAKPQTTRARITGICHEGNSQLVFLDLPGVFAPRRKLDQAMVETAWEGARGADLVLVLVDAARKTPAPETGKIIRWLNEGKYPAMLVLNKVDVADKSRLLDLTAQLGGLYPFREILMVSAATGDGMDRLRTVVAQAVPSGPWHYPDDQLTDMPERLWAAEITREQVFVQLRQELPYQVAVETEGWQDRKGKGRDAVGATVINQVIYVQRENQRPIVLGHAGSRIRQIGTAARLVMEREFERPVHLVLHVKVRENWTEDEAFLRRQGLLGER